MSQFIEPPNKFISLSDAAKDTPYSQEYLSLLARKGKLVGKKIGRNWFTTHEAVDDYIKKQGIQVLLPGFKNPIAHTAVATYALPQQIVMPKAPETAPIPPEVTSTINTISKNVLALSELQQKHIQEFWTGDEKNIKENAYITSKTWSHRFHKLNWIGDRLLRSPKKVLAVIITALVLLFLIGGGMSFGNINELGRSVSNYFKNADAL